MKITDFGIAKAVDAAPVTRSGMVMGTAHYIAPEQAGGGDAGPASDVYSLGVVGYECLAGRRPYLSENAVTVAMMHIRDPLPPLPPDVPPVVRQLIELTLTKDPRGRYATGGEFARAVVGRAPRRAAAPARRRDRGDGGGQPGDPDRARHHPRAPALAAAAPRPLGGPAARPRRGAVRGVRWRRSRWSSPCSPSRATCCSRTPRPARRPPPVATPTTTTTTARADHHDPREPHDHGDELGVGQHRLGQQHRLRGSARLGGRRRAA